MDTLALGPGWRTPPTLVQDVDDIVRGPRWVFDSWGYQPVRDAMWARADTVVWLDYPARVVLPRLARRSLSRTLRRTEVFGNRETWRGWLRADHPFWHAVTTLRQRRAYLDARTEASPQLTTIRLTDPDGLEQWLVTIKRDYL